MGCYGQLSQEYTEALSEDFWQFLQPARGLNFVLREGYMVKDNRIGIIVMFPTYGTD